MTEERERWEFPEDVCVEFEFAYYDGKQLIKLVHTLENHVGIRVRWEIVPSSSTFILELIGVNSCAFNRMMNYILNKVMNRELIMNHLFIKPCGRWVNEI